MFFGNIRSRSVWVNDSIHVSSSLEGIVDSIQMIGNSNIGNNNAEYSHEEIQIMYEKREYKSTRRWPLTKKDSYRNAEATIR